MTHQREELPLFPLKVVLFPGNILPLHIFEERYRLMVRYCLEEESNFGVIMIKKGAEVDDQTEPYNVGTAVRIVESDTMDDGRMNIITAGQYRFQIKNITNQMPYLMATIDILNPDAPPDQHRLSALMTRASELYNTYEDLLSETIPDWEIPKNVPQTPFHFGCHIATRLQITLIEKQRLLEVLPVDQLLMQEIKILRYEIQRRQATVIAERQFKAIPTSETPFWKNNSLN